MNYRLNTSLIIIVGCILLAAAGLFGYTIYTHSTSPQTATTTPQTEETENGSPEVITAQHQFKNGKHTIVGQLPVPSACHTLTAEPFFIGQGSSTVEIRFKTGTPDASTTCAQVITPRQFQITFDGPPKPSINASVDGTPAQFNLIEVPADQKLEGISDEYFKG